MDPDYEAAQEVALAAMEAASDRGGRSWTRADLYDRH